MTTTHSEPETKNCGYDGTPVRSDEHPKCFTQTCYDCMYDEPKQTGKICGNCGSHMITQDDGINESFTSCPSCGDW